MSENLIFTIASGLSIVVILGFAVALGFTDKPLNKHKQFAGGMVSIISLLVIIYLMITSIIANNNSSYELDSKLNLTIINETVNTHYIQMGGSEEEDTSKHRYATLDENGDKEIHNITSNNVTVLGVDIDEPYVLINKKVTNVKLLGIYDIELKGRDNTEYEFYIPKDETK